MVRVRLAPKLEAGLMLVWLSFFLRGGFIVLEETKMGSSYFSTLLALIVVIEGLLAFLPKTGSSEII
jgi:hypothetical protein